jgi:hypothetical protein
VVLTWISWRTINNNETKASKETKRLKLYDIEEARLTSMDLLTDDLLRRIGSAIPNASLQDGSADAEDEVEDEQEVEDRETFDYDKYRQEAFGELIEMDLNRAPTVADIMDIVIRGAFVPISALQGEVNSLKRKYVALEKSIPDLQNFHSGTTNSEACRALAKKFVGFFKFFPSDHDIKRALSITSLKELVTTEPNLGRAVSAVSVSFLTTKRRRKKKN